MMPRTLFALVLLLNACLLIVQAASPETEPFDRIVLKDMTVIKASLVKEAGDSLAYFELNDPEFTRRTVHRDQVFRWVRATAQPAPAAPAQALPPPAAPAQALPPVAAPVQAAPVQQQSILQDAGLVAPPAPQVADTENIPVVDYQVVLARLDSTERSKQRPPAVAAAPARPAPALQAIPTVPSTPPVIEEYDSNDAVPEGLSQVRLDPPTKEGVKLVPRSGLTAININPSFTSLGLGLRTWSAAGVGFSAGGAVQWGASSGFSVKTQLMLALNGKSKSRVRWYLFPLIGYQWISIEVPSITVMGMTTPSSTTDLSLMNFVFGLGAEWRIGINRNHGLAVELGYQGGSAEYTTHQDAQTVRFGGYSTTLPASDTKNTFSPIPFYLMFSYAYYF